MMEPENFLKRLARLAGREPRTDLPTRPPFGFTTRVVARLRAAEPENPWARLAVRAVPIGAAAAALALLVAQYEPPSFAPQSEISSLAQEIVRSAVEP